MERTCQQRIRETWQWSNEAASQVSSFDNKSLPCVVCGNRSGFDDNIITNGDRLPKL